MVDPYTRDIVYKRQTVAQFKLLDLKFSRLTQALINTGAPEVLGLPNLFAVFFYFDF